MLAVIETHPIQYHAPVYRALVATHGIPVTAIYGSDFSVRPYRDAEFGATLTWGGDLLGGYDSVFLSRVDARDAKEPAVVSAHGIDAALRRLAPAATLIVGYSPTFHQRAWMAAWRSGAPVLFRGETTDDEKRGGLKRCARDLALRVAYRSCARVLYIGESARRHYLARGVPRARLTFSPYCVDTTPFRATEDDRNELRVPARTRWRVGEDRLVLLFAGKISARKGVDLLCGSVRQLPPNLRDSTTVLVAGDGAMRQELERLAHLEPAVDVRVLGVQSQQELSACYHAADLLVLPSRSGETWGLVVNEALHHGVPCIVSDGVGCADDLIDENTGRICRASSTSALAEAIAQGAGLVGRRDVRDRCRAKVSNYTVARAAEGLADAYRAVVARGAGR